MNELYAKTLLYAYSHTEGYIKQIDDLVLRRAISSMYDVSSPVTQAERIIEYIEQKKLLIYIVRTIEEVVATFSKYDQDCLDYKYLKRHPKEYYKDFDYSSRSYFRHQNALVEKVSSRLSLVGIDDDFFIKKCLKINFFKALLRQVKERDNLSSKNKTKMAKTPKAVEILGKINCPSKNAERQNLIENEKVRLA